MVQAVEAPEADLAPSAASVWEIAIKRTLGKLTIGDRWLPEIARLGVRVLPVDGAVAAAVERLPFHHRDPFDRLIVVHARTESRTLATTDRTLEAYGVPVLA